MGASTATTDEQDWTEPALLNGWTRYDTAWPTFGYRVIRGRVHLRGLIKNATLSPVIYQLPAGLAPAEPHLFPCHFQVGSTAYTGRIDIGTNGGGLLSPGTVAFPSAANPQYTVSMDYLSLFQVSYVVGQ